MKLLIQHRHGDEISGVSTYVNFLTQELNKLKVESKVISTKKDGVLKWCQVILWCDLVHMNSNHLGFILLCKVLRKKVIIKYHFPFYKTTHAEYTPYTFSERIKRELKALLPKKSHPLKWKLFSLVNYLRLGIRIATACIADRHIACSSFMAKSLDFPWPVEVIYNPINLNFVEIKKLNSLELPPTFTFVGRLSSDKGIDVLLGAAAKFKKKEADFKICIIGSGSSENALKDLAKSLDLESQIEFKGRLAPEELFPIVKNSIALVVPSRIQDPAPYVVMEASSQSTCSVVAEVGGLPEVATPSGFTFEKQNIDALAEILEYALQNPMDMLERGRKAYGYTEKNFSPSITAKQLLNMCYELSPNRRTSI